MIICRLTSARLRICIVFSSYLLWYSLHSLQVLSQLSPQSLKRTQAQLVDRNMHALFCTNCTWFSLFFSTVNTNIYYTWLTHDNTHRKQVVENSYVNDTYVRTYLRCHWVGGIPFYTKLIMMHKWFFRIGCSFIPIRSGLILFFHRYALKVALY